MEKLKLTSTTKFKRNAMNLPFREYVVQMSFTCMRNSFRKPTRNLTYMNTHRNNLSKKGREEKSKPRTKLISR